MPDSLFLPILQSLQTTALADAMSSLGRPATLCLTKGALQVGLHSIHSKPQHLLRHSCLLMNEPGSKHVADTTTVGCQPYMITMISSTCRNASVACLLQVNRGSACSGSFEAYRYESTQKQIAFTLLDGAASPARLAAKLWQTVNLVVSLQWGLSSLADPDL